LILRVVKWGREIRRGSKGDGEKRQQQREGKRKAKTWSSGLRLGRYDTEVEENENENVESVGMDDYMKSFTIMIPR
jgi:hypothetical protein